MLKMVSCVSRFGRLRLTFTPGKGRGNRRSRDSRRGDSGIAVDEAEAHGIAQIQLFIETVIKLHSSDIGKGALMIDLRKPEESIPVDFRRLAKNVRMAVVGNIIFILA